MLPHIPAGMYVLCLLWNTTLQSFRVVSGAFDINC